MDVTVHEAKTQMSRLLREVEAGETVVIHRGSAPVAVLSQVPIRGDERQIWGDVKGSL